MLKKLIIFILLLLFSPCSAMAEISNPIEVTPSIIDEQTRARDILEYDIVLSNSSDRLVNLYAIVNDINPTEGVDDLNKPEDLDQSVSITSWISLSRGVIKVPAGETITVPLRIEVSHKAVPGKRHALIVFAEGGNRPTAESKAKKANQPQILINLEVKEDIVERAELSDFQTDKNVYVRFPMKFSLTVKNIGNQNTTPAGNIYIYNRKGQEVDKININPSLNSVVPETVMNFNEEWSGTKSGFGKYKAKLELEYGSLTQRDLQDTIYFWVLPWQFIAVIAGATIILIILMSIIIFRRTYHYDEPVLQSDGVINLKK